MIPVMGGSNRWSARNGERFRIDDRGSIYMQILQYTLTLPQKRRGFHIITAEVVRAAPGIAQIRKGVCQVFIQHTSASLTINENADPTVRRDFETFFNKTVPEGDL